MYNVQLVAIAIFSGLRFDEKNVPRSYNERGVPHSAQLQGLGEVSIDGKRQHKSHSRVNTADMGWRVSIVIYFILVTLQGKVTEIE